jgi:hypothetical protein
VRIEEQVRPKSYDALPCRAPSVSVFA